MVRDFRRRLVGLVTARLVISTLLFGSAVAFRLSTPDRPSADAFFVLLGLTYALTIGHILSLRLVERHRWLVDVQLAGDALVISAGVVFTGGVVSVFPLLYVLPIIGASMLQSRQGGLRLAALSTVLYTAVVASQYGGDGGYVGERWVADIGPLLPPVRIAVYAVLLNASAFFAVGALSGSLADKLRVAGDTLQRTSSALADLQAFSAHVIDSLPSGLVTIDAGGRILTFNRAAEHITGHEAGAVVGRSAGDVLQLPAAFHAELMGGFDGPRGRRADYRYQTGDGSVKEIGLVASALAIPGGPAGGLLTFQDVTEMRRLERDMRQRQRLAAVGEMAAGIAHEIRNPLASVRGSMQVLRQELTLTADQAQLMDIVLRESDRLNETIRSFLAYARPQRAGACRFDVGDVLRETAALLCNSPDAADRHEIAVVLGEGPRVFHGDEHQVRQIVWNLATNGLRAMPAGGRLELGASAEVGPSGTTTLVVQVTDQGIGIDGEQLSEVFRPFHGSFVRGSGLGLSIVHRLVSDWNGEIAVESSPGHGTVVRVRLPLGAAQPAVPAVSGATPATGVAAA